MSSHLSDPWADIDDYPIWDNQLDNEDQPMQPNWWVAHYETVGFK